MSLWIAVLILLVWSAAWMLAGYRIGATVKHSCIEALRFYGDSESYARQPSMNESIGGWIPESVPLEDRDTYVHLALRRVLNDDEPPGLERVGPHLGSSDEPGYIHHATVQLGLQDYAPVQYDGGARARVALALARAGLGPRWQGRR